VARALVPAPASCNYTTMRADADLYFSNPGPVKELIGRMERESSAATTHQSFDGLTKVSSALATAGAVSGSPTAGDTFVKDVLACMSVGTLPAGISFVRALSSNGLFEVVGGAGDPTGPVTSRGTPTYGAEPQAGQSWAGS